MEQDDLERRLDPTVNHRSVVILLSGGIDSMLLAHMTKEEARLDSCVFVDYGQPAAVAEGIAANSWCLANDIPIRHFLCPIDATELASGVGEKGPRVVAGRNLVLVALAVHHAKSRGVGNVWIGANWDDKDEYDDCTVRFVHNLSQACHAGYDVRLAAPYAGTDRKTMADEARDRGLDLSSAWSCYEPTPEGNQCGECNSCRSRRAFLARASR
jgi:7-cyano-7-deazaguanine synthase